MRSNLRSIICESWFLFCTEVGAMRPENHEELYSKAKTDSSGFASARKELAKEFYHQTASQESTQLILQPYQERTGLSLEDVHRVFEEGDWLLGRPRYYYGGPRWAKIAKATLDLRRLIKTGDWEEVPDLIEEIKTLRHNNGLIVEKFRELDP
jgi:hypothetical protein